MVHPYFIRLTRNNGSGRPSGTNAKPMTIKQLLIARLCENHGITFIGPSANTFSLLGDKARARQRVRDSDVPVLAGTAGCTTLDEMSTERKSS